MNFFWKESKCNKKKILVVGRGGGEGVVRVSDFFFFSKESMSKKKCFIFEGVKVREDWLV